MTVWMFPGQGSQAKGMGDTLFERFPEETGIADAQLGYSIADLCRHDRDGLLRRTDYTQPALYMVCALSVLARRHEGEAEPDYVIGHSLGEYAALFAAGVFDFATGLKLVQRRGQLMAAASDGGMLAIVGQNEAGVRDLIDRQGLDRVDIANINSPAQIVLSGVKAQIERCAEACADDGIMAIPLNVSAAFHSHLMADVAVAFSDDLRMVEFKAPNIPVIANVTARAYGAVAPAKNVPDLLSRQIEGTVRWQEAIQYLIHRGETEFIEVGPGNVLTKLMKPIKAEPLPAFEPEPVQSAEIVRIKPAVDRHQPEAARTAPIAAGSVAARALGTRTFKQRYGLDYAYVTGSMYRGIASARLVAVMAEAGCLGFLGTGGMALDAVARDIAVIKDAVGGRRNWGANLLSIPDDPDAEMDLAKLYVAENVPVIEASAFIALSRALVHYRYAGAKRGADGRLEGVRRVMLKASRPEVVRQFLQAPPAEMLDGLIAEGLLDQEAAYVAERLPIADDVTAESDSGGHTDQASPLTLIPTFLRLRDQMSRAYPDHPIHVGAAGGIGTPEAIAGVLALGADYVVTGSINQATVESGMSDAVKELLTGLDVSDFAYAPAGDMFELGAKVQVVRKGSFFAARAERLYQLYRHYDSLDDLPDDVRTQVEDRFFERRFGDVWQDIETWLSSADPALLDRARSMPKVKMALVFRSYFRFSADLALDGVPDSKVNYQVHSGPALGAFNHWAAEVGLSAWRDRHADLVAMSLMDGAAGWLASWVQESRELDKEA